MRMEQLTAIAMAIAIVQTVIAVTYVEKRYGMNEPKRELWVGVTVGLFIGFCLGGLFLNYLVMHP